MTRLHVVFSIAALLAAFVGADRHMFIDKMLWSNEQYSLGEVMFVDGVPIGIRPQDSNVGPALYRYNFFNGSITDLVPTLQTVIKATHYLGSIFALAVTGVEGCAVIKVSPHTGVLEAVGMGQSVCQQQPSTVSIAGVAPKQQYVECVLGVADSGQPGAIFGFQFIGNPRQSWVSQTPIGALLPRMECDDTMLVTTSPGTINNGNEYDLRVYAAESGDLLVTSALPTLSTTLSVVSSPEALYAAAVDGDEIIRVGVGDNIATTTTARYPGTIKVVLYFNRKVYSYAGETGIVVSVPADSLQPFETLFHAEGGVFTAIATEAGTALFIGQDTMFVMAASGRLIATLPCGVCGSDSVVQGAGRFVFITTTMTTRGAAFDTETLKFVWGPRMLDGLAPDLKRVPTKNYFLLNLGATAVLCLLANTTETQTATALPTPTQNITRTHGTPSGTQTAPESITQRVTESRRLTPSRVDTSETVTSTLSETESVTNQSTASATVTATMSTSGSKTNASSASGTLTLVATATQLITATPPLIVHSLNVTEVDHLSDPPTVLASPWRTTPLRIKNATIVATACHRMVCGFLITGAPHRSAAQTFVAITKDGGGRGTAPFPEPIPITVTGIPTTIFVVAVPGSDDAVFLVVGRLTVVVVNASAASRTIWCGNALVWAMPAGVALLRCGDGTAHMIRVKESSDIAVFRVLLPVSANVASFTVSRVPGKMGRVAYIVWYDDGPVVSTVLVDAESGAAAADPLRLWHRVTLSVVVIAGAETNEAQSVAILTPTGVLGVSFDSRNDWSSDGVLAAASWTITGPTDGPRVMIVLLTSAALQIRDIATGAIMADGNATWALTGAALSPLPRTAITATFDNDGFIGTLPCGNGHFLRFVFTRSSGTAIRLDAAVRTADPDAKLDGFCPDGPTMSCMAVFTNQNVGQNGPGLAIGRRDAAYAIPPKAVLTTTSTSVVAAVVAAADSVTAFAPPPPGTLTTASRINLTTVISVPPMQHGSSYVLGMPSDSTTPVLLTVASGAATSQLLYECTGAGSIGPKSLSSTGHVACSSTDDVLLFSPGNPVSKSVAYSSSTPPCVVVLSVSRRWSSTAPLVSDDVAVTGGARGGIVHLSLSANRVAKVGGNVIDIIVDRGGRSALFVTDQPLTADPYLICAVDAVSFEIYQLFKTGRAPAQPLLAIGTGLATSTSPDFVVALDRTDCSVARSVIGANVVPAFAAPAVAEALREAFKSMPGGPPLLAAAADRPAHGRWPILGNNSALCVVFVDGPDWENTLPKCLMVEGRGDTGYVCEPSVLALTDCGTATLRLSNCNLAVVDVLSGTQVDPHLSAAGVVFESGPATPLANNATALVPGADGTLFPLRLGGAFLGDGWALPAFTSAVSANALVTVQMSVGQAVVNVWDPSVLDATVFKPARVDAAASRIFPFIATLRSIPKAWRPVNPLSAWFGNTCPTRGVCADGAVDGGFLSWAAPSLAGMASRVLMLRDSRITGVVDLSDVTCFQQVNLAGNNITGLVVGSKITAVETLHLSDNRQLQMVGNPGLVVESFGNTIKDLDLSRTAVICGQNCLVGTADSNLLSIVLEEITIAPPLVLNQLPPRLALLNLGGTNLSAAVMPLGITRIKLDGEHAALAEPRRLPTLPSTMMKGKGPQLLNVLAASGATWALLLSRTQLNRTIMSTAPDGVSWLDLSGNPELTSPANSAATEMHLCSGARVCDSPLQHIDLSGTGISGWLDLARSNVTGVVPRLTFLSVENTQVGGDVDARGWASDLRPRDGELTVLVANTKLRAVVEDRKASAPARLNISLDRITVAAGPIGYAVAKDYSAAFYAGPFGDVSLILPMSGKLCHLSLEHWAVVRPATTPSAAPITGPQTVAFFERFQEGMPECVEELERLVQNKDQSATYTLENATVEAVAPDASGLSHIRQMTLMFSEAGGGSTKITVLEVHGITAQGSESWCSVVSPGTGGSTIQMRLDLNSTATVLQVERVGSMRELRSVTAVTMPSIRRQQAVAGGSEVVALFPTSDLFSGPTVAPLLNGQKPGPCTVVGGRVLQCDEYPFTFYKDCSRWAPIGECKEATDPVLTAAEIATQPDMGGDTPGHFLGAAKTLTWQSCENVAPHDRRPDGFLRLRTEQSAAIRDGCIPLAMLLPPKMMNGDASIPVRVQDCADPSSINCVNAAPGNVTGSAECGRLALQMGTQFTSCAMRGFDASGPIRNEVGATTCTPADAASQEAFDIVSRVTEIEQPGDVYVRPHCAPWALRLYTCNPNDGPDARGALLYTIDTQASCWPRALDGMSGVLQLQCSPCLYYIDVTTFALPLWMLALSSLKDIVLMVLGTLLLGSRRVRRFIAGIKGGIVIRALPYPGRALHRRASRVASPAGSAPRLNAESDDIDAMPAVIASSPDPRDGMVSSDNDDEHEVQSEAAQTVDMREAKLANRYDTVNDDIDNRLDDLVRRLDPEPMPEIEFVNTFRMLSGMDPVATVQVHKFRAQSPVSPMPAASSAYITDTPSSSRDRPAADSPREALRSEATHGGGGDGEESIAAALLSTRSYGGTAGDIGDDGESAVELQRTFAAEDRFAALHATKPLYQALVRVVLMNRRHHILNPTDPSVQAAWGAFVAAFEAPHGELRRCMELETHSRAHRVFCRCAPAILRRLTGGLEWLPRDLRLCHRRCDVASRRVASDAELRALDALDAVVECEHCIVETAAIDRHFTPQPWMLVLQTAYAAFLFVVCFARTFSKTYDDGWQHYEAFYFEFINSCTSVGLLTNSLLRVWYTYEDHGQLGVFVWISLALVIAPMATHIIPAMVVFPWLPLFVVAFTAALFVVAAMLAWAAKRAPLERLFTNVVYETRARKACVIAGNVVSRLTATFAVTIMLQSLFNYFVIFNMRDEHRIDYTWPGLPGENTVAEYEWRSRDWACFFRLVWSAVRQDGLALKTRVFSVFA